MFFFTSRSAARAFAARKGTKVSDRGVGAAKRWAVYGLTA